MQKQTWDPSVKSLTAFPQVLDDDEREARHDAEAGRRVPRPAEGSAGRDPAAARQGAGRRATSSRARSRRSPPRRRPGTTVIKIEPANPEVVYVPTYNPTSCTGRGRIRPIRRTTTIRRATSPGAALFTFGGGRGRRRRAVGQLQLGRRQRQRQRQQVQQLQQDQHPERQLAAQRRAPQGRRSTATQASQQKFGGGQRAGRRFARAVPRPRRAGPAGYRARRRRPVQGRWRGRSRRDGDRAADGDAAQATAAARAIAAVGRAGDRGRRARAIAVAVRAIAAGGGEAAAGDVAAASAAAAVQERASTVPAAAAPDARSHSSRGAASRASAVAAARRAAVAVAAAAVAGGGGGAVAAGAA